MSDKSRLENNNLELMNIYNAVENLPNSGGGAGDVKLYDSIANMNLDHSVSEGQLAIVYSNVSANITADTEFQVGTFPETVVLPTAMEDYMEVGFRAVDEEAMFDCWGQFGPDEYRIDCYTDAGEIRIQYGSQDGLTYTRTRFMKNNEEISGDEMDFGLVVKFGNRWGEAEWNDAIGYFTQAGNIAFDGLYQYGDNSYNLAKTQFTADKEKVYTGVFYGPNGAETGNLQNIENLTIEQALVKAKVFSTISNISLNENITSTANMFDACGYLLTVPNINMSNIVNTSYMFQGCQNLISVPNFNTSNVVNMAGMFQSCGNLTSVSNFDTNKVTDMAGMFYGDSNIHNIPNFNTSNVTNMYAMFWAATNLTTMPNFNTEKVENMQSMFVYCFNLISIPNFNTTNVTSTAGMFTNCVNLTDVPNFDTTNVTSMADMFRRCNTLITIPNFNTINVTNMSYMFAESNSISDVPSLDASNVEDIRGMFHSCSNLKTIGDLNTTNAVYMNHMFCGCQNLIVAPNIDTSNVVNISYMFANCVNLTDVPVFNLNSIPSYYNMSSMFSGCNNLSANAYANITNSLPEFKEGIVYLAWFGLNAQNFTKEQCKILSNKRYADATPYAIDAENVAMYWNMYYE